MLFQSRMRRAIAAVALGGLLAFGNAGVASADGSRGHDHDGHHAKHHSIRTMTDLTVYGKYACAKVTSHKGKPSGKVVFTLSRKSGKWEVSDSSYLRDGKACVKLPRLRPGWYKLTAHYEGDKCFAPSEDTEYFKVRGHGYYKHHNKHHESYKHHMYSKS
jgi:hypothetical protein